MSDCLFILLLKRQEARFESFKNVIRSLTSNFHVKFALPNTPHFTEVPKGARAQDQYLLITKTILDGLSE